MPGVSRRKRRPLTMESQRVNGFPSVLYGVSLSNKAGSGNSVTRRYTLSENERFEISGELTFQSSTVVSSFAILQRKSEGL